MQRSYKKTVFLKKMMMPLINDLLARLLSPYEKYEALTFMYEKDGTWNFLVQAE